MIASGRYKCPLTGSCLLVTELCKDWGFFFYVWVILIMLTNKSNAIVKIIYTNGDITGDALIFSVVTVG